MGGEGRRGSQSIGHESGCPELEGSGCDMRKDARTFHLEGPRGIHFIAGIMEQIGWVIRGEESPSQMPLHVASPTALSCSLALYSPLLVFTSYARMNSSDLVAGLFPLEFTLVSQLTSLCVPPLYLCLFSAMGIRIALPASLDRNSTCKDLRIATSSQTALQVSLSPVASSPFPGEPPQEQLIRLPGPEGTSKQLLCWPP